MTKRDTDEPPVEPGTSSSGTPVKAPIVAMTVKAPQELSHKRVHEATLFEVYKQPERRKRRWFVRGALWTGAVIGQVVVNTVGIGLPLSIATVVGMILMGESTLFAWDLSKKLSRKRWFSKIDPKTPQNWPEKPTELIIAYAYWRIQQLSTLAKRSGWREVYAGLCQIPHQLENLLDPWRKAKRDQERLEELRKRYPDDSKDPSIQSLIADIDLSIKTAKQRSTNLGDVITDQLLQFDRVDAKFSSVQHASGNNDTAILKTVHESMEGVQQRVDEILEGIRQVEEPPTTEEDHMKAFDEALGQSEDTPGTVYVLTTEADPKPKKS